MDDDATDAVACDDDDEYDGRADDDGDDTNINSSNHEKTKLASLYASKYTFHHQGCTNMAQSHSNKDGNAKTATTCRPPVCDVCRNAKYPLKRRIKGEVRLRKKVNVKHEHVSSISHARLLLAPDIMLQKIRIQKTKIKEMTRLAKQQQEQSRKVAELSTVQLHNVKRRIMEQQQGMITGGGIVNRAPTPSELSAQAATAAAAVRQNKTQPLAVTVSRATIETAAKGLAEQAQRCRFRKAVVEATTQQTTTTTATATVATRMRSVSEPTTTGASIPDTETDTDLFPWQLHDMLDEAEEKGHAHIVSWCDNGMAFTIHAPSQMVPLLQHYFRCREQTDTIDYTSFLRQLKCYRFKKVTTGRDKGMVSHPEFHRGMRSVAVQMKRKAVVEAATMETAVVTAAATGTRVGAEAEAKLNSQGETKKVNGVERTLVEGRAVVGFVRGKPIYKPSKMITIQFDVTFNTKVLELGLGTTHRNQVIVTAVTNPVSSVQIGDIMTYIGKECLLDKSIEYSVQVLQHSPRPIRITFLRIVPQRRSRAKQNKSTDIRIPNGTVKIVANTKQTAAVLSSIAGTNIPLSTLAGVLPATTTTTMTTTAKP